MNIVIVIPVYRNYNNEEEISLKRCCQILSKYKTVLVCPDNFDSTQFDNLWKSYNLELSTERFDNHYFANIAGYNRLLLSECFYSRFSNYDYMLIYQPDAYVFEDKLEEWCNKGYDYIGAPLIGKWYEEIFNPNELRVGNGGFSLRRIHAFMDYFTGSRHVLSLNQIAGRINLRKKIYTRWIFWLLMAFGWHNKPKSFANKWKYNEDDFWSGVLTNTKYELTKPTPLEAFSFAFERFPKESFQLTKKLPFGCHAWAKYQYDSFWKDYIK